MSTSIARIGILSPVTEAGWWMKLKEGIEELGYVTRLKRNLHSTARSAAGQGQA
jgi:hypothetical protein